MSAAKGALSGRRILVVEDEYLIASVIVDIIERAGGTVIGPMSRLEPSRALARREALDGAVLDVKLEGDLTYPLADELLARGVPVVLATGFTAPSLPTRLQRVPRLAKPFTARQLTAMLAAALAAA